MSQLTVFITFKVDPNKIEEWRQAHRPVWKACSQESECLLFDIFQDPKEPGTFRFVEVWSKGRDWFENVQMKKEYYVTMFPKSEKTWVAPPQMEFFERDGEACIFRQEYLDGGKKME